MPHGLKKGHKEEDEVFTILIIDDSTPFRKSLRHVLQRRFPGVAIEEAADGREGLAKVDARRPQLIFMDVHLPGENGLQLTRKIKNDYAETCIAVVTIDNMPEYRKAAFDSGADHFGVKGTWKGNEIVAVVESVLAGRAAYSAGAVVSSPMA